MEELANNLRFSRRLFDKGFDFMRTTVMKQVW